ncbi:hypothetical protein VTL71DRAFT_12689 [Oculimacula yallundae]|uniref:Uncharacterized protein n=1 Tax=Oculimacula yallundae TaxID=86028 RepID=A0ABR4CN77_9HELO
MPPPSVMPAFVSDPDLRSLVSGPDLVNLPEVPVATLVASLWTLIRTAFNFHLSALYSLCLSIVESYWNFSRPPQQSTISTLVPSLLSTSGPISKDHIPYCTSTRGLAAEWCYLTHAHVHSVVNRDSKTPAGSMQRHLSCLPNSESQPKAPVSTPELDLPTVRTLQTPAVPISRTQNITSSHQMFLS